MTEPLGLQGLPKLLRAVSASLGNETELLTKELLERSAIRLERLEAVAKVAYEIVLMVPNKEGHKRRDAKIPRALLSRLWMALNNEPDFRSRRID